MSDINNAEELVTLAVTTATEGYKEAHGLEACQGCGNLTCRELGCYYDADSEELA